MKFTVKIKEVHTVDIEVEAENPYDAIHKALNDYGQRGEETLFEVVSPAGIGPLNVYEWRVYGAGLDEVGVPASKIIHDQS